MELGLGSVSNLEQVVSRALAAPVQEARAYARTCGRSQQPTLDLLRPVADEDFQLLHSMFDGTPRGDTWVPIAMKIISKEKRRRSLHKADAPWFSSDILILRQEAAEALEPFLTRHGELLPLTCEQAELAAFNVFCVVDALDEAASTVDRFSSGRIMGIEKYVFHKEAVQDMRLFKITSLLHSPLFVGEEFVERWRSADLKGLEFTRAWEG